LADFAIFKLIAEYWGCGEMFRSWESPGSVFRILANLSRGQPCDITGIRDYEMIEAYGGIQWPWPESGGQMAQDGEPETRLGTGPYDRSGPSPATGPVLFRERRLFEDGRFYHSDGRARFIFESPRPPPEPPTENFPLVLLTGRGSAAQWHTQTRTGKSALLRTLYPESIYVEINPADARTLGIAPNERVVIESQRAKIRAKAFITPLVQPGQVFVPMHYDTVNKLTDAVFDPYSRQPSYKACAVRMRREAEE
jgi:assimilatory nitrate reductase catalytic subunit